MEHSDLNDAILSDLRSLVDKPCWAIFAGTNTGSTVQLELGEKHPRDHILSNPHLSDEERACDGEMALLIECAWRLDTSTAVVCGSADASDDIDLMVRGLNLLIGRAVERVEVTLPAFDLRLEFGGSLRLTIFCHNLSSNEDSPENYFFYTPERTYIVGPRGDTRENDRR